MKLRERERRRICAIFAAVLPLHEDPAFAGTTRGEADFERYLDALMRAAPRDVVLGLRVCASIVWFSPLWLLGRPRLFGSLCSDERAALLERMTQSRVYLLRELPMLFKTAVCLGLCGLPAVQRRIGLNVVDATPPCWARDQVEGSGRLPRLAERA